MLDGAKGRPQEALACYRSALAIDQWHAASKARLGALLLQMGGEWLHMAEVHLREVVSGDGFDARAWHVLGLVERGVGMWVLLQSVSDELWRQRKRPLRCRLIHSDRFCRSCCCDLVRAELT
ncbi:hypothetical protein CLOP_g14747 [Closterium sp. NIES-67]|nr:hypothetical protein CLOP_g14747 [Closterium sp. NIES-67]